MTQYAESYLEVGFDLLTEAAWATQPVRFRINVRTMNPEGERGFAVVHHLRSPYGGESDRASAGEATQLAAYDTWSSTDLEITPISPGSHELAAEVYQDGQYIGGGSHTFEVIEP